MMPLYGNSGLEPSTSNYYGFSIESLRFSNSSLEIYFNNVNNMIVPMTMPGNIMEYANSDKVNLYGFNWNFSIPLHDKITIKSVFSYTDGSSKDIKLIEGMSKYSMNTRLKLDVLKQISLILTSKYNSAKKVFVYTSNSSTGSFQPLNSYWMTDVLLSYKYKRLSLKCGVKNIFNYSPQAVEENLSTIDPGRRIYFATNLSI